MAAGEQGSTPPPQANFVQPWRSNLASLGSLAKPVDALPCCTTFGDALPSHYSWLTRISEDRIIVCVLSLNLFANVGSNTRRDHNPGPSIFAVSVIPCEKVLVTIVTILSARKQLPKNGSS